MLGILYSRDEMAVFWGGLSYMLSCSLWLVGSLVFFADNGKTSF